MTEQQKHLKPELEQLIDGTYRWNFRIGEAYFLEWRQGLITNTPSPGEEACAVHLGLFFGSSEDRYLFFSEKDGKIHQYSSHVTAPVLWCLDRESKERRPAVIASYDCEVDHDFRKNYIAHQLAYFDKLRRERRIEVMW